MPYATSEHEYYSVTCARMREIILNTAIQNHHTWARCAICEAEGDDRETIVHENGCEYERMRGA